MWQLHNLCILMHESKFLYYMIIDLLELIKVLKLNSTVWISFFRDKECYRMLLCSNKCLQCLLDGILRNTCRGISLTRGWGEVVLLQITRWESEWTCPWTTGIWSGGFLCGPEPLLLVLELVVWGTPQTSCIAKGVLSSHSQERSWECLVWTPFSRCVMAAVQAGPWHVELVAS